MQEVTKHEQQRLQRDRRPVQFQRGLGELVCREGAERSIVLRTGPPVRLHTGRAESDFQLAPVSNGQFPYTVEPQRPQGLTQFVRDR